jgi:hypothetical protein
MIFSRGNVLLLALGLLAVLSPYPGADAAKKKRAGGRLKDPYNFAEGVTDEEVEVEARGGDALYIPSSGSGRGSNTGKGKGKGGSGKCGYPGQPCCADPSNRCLPGLGCKYPADFTDPEDGDYTCQVCGGSGQPCCNVGCGESCEKECLDGACNLFTNTVRSYNRIAIEYVRRSLFER